MLVRKSWFSHWKPAVLLATLPVLMGATGSPGESISPAYTLLTLTGQGFSEQATEFVTVNAATETWNASPSRAMSENADDMKRLRARLRDMGIAEADFRTANFQLNRGSDPNDQDGKPEQGFAVRHQLSVVVRNVDGVGKVMDALVDAGAKNLSVGRGWGYSESVAPEAMRSARASAIKDAMGKANDYAAALGMRIHRVVSIRDQGGYVTEQVSNRAGGVVGETQIESRPKTVLASVGIEFELAK